MNQYCKTKRKTIVLQMDISGKTNQEELHALLASVGSDNENLETLGGDSDTEFIPVTNVAREALITIILRLRTLPVPRETYRDHHWT